MARSSWDDVKVARAGDSAVEAAYSGGLRRTPTRDLISSTSAHDPARPTIA